MLRGLGLASYQAACKPPLGMLGRGRCASLLGQSLWHTRSFAFTLEAIGGQISLAFLAGHQLEWQTVVDGSRAEVYSTSFVSECGNQMCKKRCPKVRCYASLRGRANQRFHGRCFEGHVAQPVPGLLRIPKGGDNTSTHRNCGARACAERLRFEHPSTLWCEHNISSVWIVVRSLWVLSPEACCRLQVASITSCLHRHH